MEKIKICPNCRDEYQYHINICADCGIDLIEFSEIDKHQQLSEELDPDKSVLVAKGPINSLKRLISIIENARICHEIQLLKRELHSELTPISEFGIFVHEDNTEQFYNIVQTTSEKEFPELMESQKKLEEGKCPACGAGIQNEKVCPECELPLWFEEEE